MARQKQKRNIHTAHLIDLDKSKNNIFELLIGGEKQTSKSE